MSNDRICATGSAEKAFLARLTDVSDIAEETEQVHLAAALAAVREADPTASSRAPLRPTIPLWRKPRMALSNLAAIIASFSLPVKAAAASTVAVAAIGGGVAVTNTPPENPPAETPAVEALDDAAENTRFDELPARGESARDTEELGTLGHGDEDDDHGVNGQDTAEEAKDDGQQFGAETAAEASDGKSADARDRAEDAAESRRDAEAREAAAQERRDAEAREEAQARADAEARRQDARDNAATSDDSDDGDVETDDTDETDDESSGGGAQGDAGRANADSAPGR